jgi:hypothetical protein
MIYGPNRMLVIKHSVWLVDSATNGPPRTRGREVCQRLRRGRQGPLPSDGRRGLIPRRRCRRCRASIAVRRIVFRAEVDEHVAAQARDTSCQQQSDQRYRNYEYRHEVTHFGDLLADSRWCTQSRCRLQQHNRGRGRYRDYLIQRQDYWTSSSSTCGESSDADVA